MTEKERILKSAKFNLRLTKQERSDFKKLASDNGKVLSDELRNALTEYVNRHSKI